MKKILCFGDSNTYGFNPANGGRYDKNIRWTGVLSRLVDGRAVITECGCNNRNAFIDNPDGILQTGYKILPEYLKKANYDIVILAIGINDTQKFYNATPDEFKIGIENLINIVRNNLPEAVILLLCPSRLNQDALLSGFFKFHFDENSVKKSFELQSIYKDAADKNNCLYLDLNDIAEVSKIDGLHYEPNEHRKIARAVYEILS